MRRSMIAITLATLLLTGCASEKGACEEAGGEWVKTGQNTTFMPVYVNNRPIMIPQTRDTYECQGTEEGTTK